MRESVEIFLSGVPYQLRPTWSAYAEIESRTGRSIRALWMAIASGDAKLTELTAIVVAGMKAADSTMNIGEQAAMRAIYESGVWWDQDDGVSLKIVEYLEALGWTPEQREKIVAEIESMNKRVGPSAGSTPSAPQSTD